VQSLEIFVHRGVTGKARATHPRNAQRSAHSTALGGQILVDEDPPPPTRLPPTLPALPVTNQSVPDNFLG